jgi:hypothetical protein
VTEHAGGCHCGNVRVTFATALAPSAWELRECQCRFCRKHGARALTDPRGSLTLAVRDAGQLIRYRFGQRTAEFLVCGGCGVFVGATLAVDDRRYATLNANTLDCALELTQAPVAVDYDAETRAQREARRAARWTSLVGNV